MAVVRTPPGFPLASNKAPASYRPCPVDRSSSAPCRGWFVTLTEIGSLQLGSWATSEIFCGEPVALSGISSSADCTLDAPPDLCATVTMQLAPGSRDRPLQV